MVKTVQEPVTMEDAIEKVGIGWTQWMLLIICGLTFMSDSAEVTFLSFVTEKLKCQWGLSGRQETLIAQAVFVGMVIGSPIWGIIADRVGRRLAFVLTSVMICVFGFATALCSNFYQLVTVRAIVGFAVAGLPVGFDVLAESLPTSARGGFLLYIEYFWTLGGIYVSFCAYMTLDYSWQVFTMLAAVPTLVASILGFFFLPESPRWLAEENRDEEALKIVNKWAKDNGTNLQFRALVEEKHAEKEEGGHGPIDLFKKPKLRKVTVLMLINWFGWGLAYYGVVCLLPRIFQQKEGVAALQANLTDNTSNSTAWIQNYEEEPLTQPVPENILNVNSSMVDSELDGHENVRRLSNHRTCRIKFDFGDIGISALAEVLGVVAALSLIDRGGRVLTQVIFYVFAALSAVVLGFPEYTSTKVLTAAASFARLSELAGSSACWVHTPELYPTHLRAEAHGVLNLASKVGAVFAQYLISDSFTQWQSGLSIAFVSLMAAASAGLLPETANKALGEDSEESEYEDATSDTQDQNSDSSSVE